MFTVNMFQVQKTGSNTLLDQDHMATEPISNFELYSSTGTLLVNSFYIYIYANSMYSLT